MKKAFTLIAALLLTASVWAQSPEKMSYQAVIRNSSDALVANTQIGMEINIRQGMPSGTIVYSETQTPTTNANGLVSIEIGGGTGFDTINWANGTYFIETKTAVVPPLTTYTITGTSQLLSVPYALHAKTTDSILNPLWFSNTYGINTNNIVGIGTSTPDANMHIIDQTGISPLKMESDDNIYTIWQSNRIGVDDYLIGIDGGNNRFVFANLTTSEYPLTFKNDKVGINQINPQTNLDINGTLKIVDGTEGSGKVLTSDINGNASWEAIVMPDGSETKVTAGTNVTVTGSGTTANPYEISASSGSATHYIGELYDGGVVFWVDHTGQHGLIASMVDLSIAQVWSNVSSTLIGTTAQSDWDGITNTTAIIGQGGHSSSAAKLCADYTNADYGTGTYSDWYLPSRGELNDLWNNIKAVQKALDSDGNSSTTAIVKNNYWSSLERTSSYAWYFNFYNGDTNDESKGITFYVRAVRAF